MLVIYQAICALLAALVVAVMLDGDDGSRLARHGGGRIGSLLTGAMLLIVLVLRITLVK